MDKILHYLKDPKLWELWYIPYYGSCTILSINRRSPLQGSFKGFYMDSVSTVLIKAFALLGLLFSSRVRL